MLPTHVGMVRPCSGPSRPRERAPHARGDGPEYTATYAPPALCSPRTWGWSEQRAGGGGGPGVLPTHVGMVRVGRCSQRHQAGAPHARGDGPPSHSRTTRNSACSPRTWGWSARGAALTCPDEVLPTHVGMVRPPAAAVLRGRCAPHARGDGPPSAKPRVEDARCSPRTWGWSVVQRHGEPRVAVLPTHVGMVRRSAAGSRTTCCAPHARGDGPSRARPGGVVIRCSPRTWGWSGRRPLTQFFLGVLPTHVGMVPALRAGFE